jgi:hypothetical protein
VLRVSVGGGVGDKVRVVRVCGESECRWLGWC